MMSSEEGFGSEIPEEFQKYFWDVVFEDLSFDKNRLFVAERLLNYGGSREIKWLLASTGRQFIESVIKSSRNLNPKTRNYWEVMFTSSSLKFR